MLKRWLRTDFQKFHLVLMLLALANILLGLALAYSFVPYYPAATWHMISGVALVGSLLLPLFFPKGKQLYKALKARTFLTRRDLEQKKPFVLAAKGTAMLMALGFAVLFITFLMLQLGVGNRGNIFSFHRSLLWFMVVVAVLHPVFMILSQRKPGKPKTSA